MAGATAVRSVLLVAATVPPLAIAHAVATYARNVPWWDQWGLVPFMAEAAQGRFPAPALWAPVNEHRIPVALLLQGALGWATRWDVRGDAWVNVALAAGSLAALAATARRTVGGTGAAAVTLVCAAMAFTPLAGQSWTAGWITPAFAAATCAALLAWQLARPTRTPLALAGMILTASAGALSFGSGLVLVALLPLALVAGPGPRRRRAAQAAVALAAGAILVWAYASGWRPQRGDPRTMAEARLDDYARYALAYVGGAVGAAGLREARAWGAGMLAALVLAGGWLWMRRPELQPALVPWAVLAGFGLGNGFLTAHGRLDNGMHTALLVRYVPTAGLFVAGVAGMLAMLAADVRARSRPAGVALLAAFAVATLAGGRIYVARSGARVGDMAALARRLDAVAPCLASCATAKDACLARICWDAKVARRLCPRLEVARIGPFRDRPAPASP